MKTYKKDPDAILDYSVDWSPWLAEDDAIDTSTWIVPDEITHYADGLDDSHIDRIATVWLSGGDVGTCVVVTNRIVTDQGRTDDRSFKIVIDDR